jgi:hypothetical protein
MRAQTKVSSHQASGLLNLPERMWRKPRPRPGPLIAGPVMLKGMPENDRHTASISRTSARVRQSTP